MHNGGFSNPRIFSIFTGVVTFESLVSQNLSDKVTLWSLCACHDHTNDWTRKKWLPILLSKLLMTDRFSLPLWTYPSSICHVKAPGNQMICSFGAPPQILNHFSSQFAVTFWHSINRDSQFSAHHLQQRFSVAKQLCKDHVMSYHSSNILLPIDYIVPEVFESTLTPAELEAFPFASQPILVEFLVYYLPILPLSPQSFLVLVTIPVAFTSCSSAFVDCRFTVCLVVLQNHSFLLFLLTSKMVHHHLVEKPWIACRRDQGYVGMVAISTCFSS